MTKQSQIPGSSVLLVNAAAKAAGTMPCSLLGKPGTLGGLVALMVRCFRFQTGSGRTAEEQRKKSPGSVGWIPVVRASNGRFQSFRRGRSHSARKGGCDHGQA